jgi:hypothetical protein
MSEPFKIFMASSVFSSDDFLWLVQLKSPQRERGSDELERVIRPDRLPGFDGHPSLPYLTPYAKEITRWRPKDLSNG